MFSINIIEMNSGNYFNVTIASTDTDVKVTCIEKSPEKDNCEICYEKTYTSDDTKKFPTGNLTNFIKICKEVFENNDKKHKTLFSSLDKNTLNIKIMYSSFFDFEIDLCLPYSHTIQQKSQFSDDVLNDIQNIKRVIGGILDEHKKISEYYDKILEDQNKLSTEFAIIKNNITENSNVVNNNLQNINTDDVSDIIKTLFDKISRMEKFIFSEITHIKITEDDNEEKIPIKCPNLTIHFMDSMCTTVNKYMFHNDEPNYIISANQKANFSENLKMIKCKNLFINTQIFTDGINLDNMPLTVDNLTINCKNDFIDFGFVTTINPINIKNLTVQNINKFKNFDIMVKHVSPQILGISNSENIIKETSFENLGYQFKENIRGDHNYTIFNTSIYIKIPLQ